ncbi:MAG: cobalamin-independent methionine synthase II family protein [Betaproteobacteria bacterium]|nr:cobalamin-independent methionine synthase II family protein [Betaproteobacteria bacterium]
MKRSDQRILSTHVGSLIRPKALLDSHKAGGKGYDQDLKKSVADVVARQVKAGIDVVNDGEYGKSGWANYVLDRMTGFVPQPNRLYEAVWLGRDRVRFKEFMETEFPRGAKGTPGHDCVGPITYQGHAEVRRDLENVKAAAAAAGAHDVFFTAVAPASVGYDASNEYYKSEEDYVFAISDALREEYLEIHKAGVVLQVDDAVLANMFDHLTAQSPKKYRDWAELRIEALNRALAGIPEDRIRYHICFGSWHVPHVADAQLEDIVGLMLKVRAGAYSIEAANVRHEHEWHVWEKTKLPEGKILIPGIVTHHTTTVEHPKLVAERIVNFAKVLGRENVIAGTDCGFAQSEGIQRVHPQVMWAKFESLAEGARLASKQLWG